MVDNNNKCTKFKNRKSNIIVSGILRVKTERLKDKTTTPLRARVPMQADEPEPPMSSVSGPSNAHDPASTLEEPTVQHEVPSRFAGVKESRVRPPKLSVALAIQEASRSQMELQRELLDCVRGLWRQQNELLERNNHLLEVGTAQRQELLEWLMKEQGPKQTSKKRKRKSDSLS